jgi:hypothetical protein
MKIRSTLVTAALLCLAVALPGSNVLAQQKHQVSFKIPNENSKYTVSQNVDIGDAPNHFVRIFETHAIIPDNTASINGLKLVEVISRGIGDLTDGHGGSSSSYLVFLAENGDKLFSRNNVVVQRVSGKLTSTWAGPITGGTGKLAGIQGTTHLFSNFDPNPGGTVSNTQIDIEYTGAQQAQSGGTAQEARAMLDKAVAAVKADRDVALAMFNKGEGGFLQGDLYPFCYRMSDGKAVAGGAVLNGTDIRTAKDAVGKASGLEIYAGGQKPEGQITEVTYVSAKFGTTEPVFPKVSFVTRVADLVCGVGYYK